MRLLEGLFCGTADSRTTDESERVRQVLTFTTTRYGAFPSLGEERLGRRTGQAGGARSGARVPTPSGRSAGFVSKSRAVRRCAPWAGRWRGRPVARSCTPARWCSSPRELRVWGRSHGGPPCHLGGRSPRAVSPSVAAPRRRPFRRSRPRARPFALPLSRRAGWRRGTRREAAPLAGVVPAGGGCRNALRVASARPLPAVIRLDVAV
jgi:hypothetical protein